MGTWVKEARHAAQTKTLVYTLTVCRLNADALHALAPKERECVNSKAAFGCVSLGAVSRGSVFLRVSCPPSQRSAGVFQVTPTRAKT